MSYIHSGRIQQTGQDNGRSQGFYGINGRGLGESSVVQGVGPDGMPLYVQVTTDPYVVPPVPGGATADQIAALAMPSGTGPGTLPPGSYTISTSPFIPSQVTSGGGGTSNVPATTNNTNLLFIAIGAGLFLMLMMKR